MFLPHAGFGLPELNNRTMEPSKRCSAVVAELSLKKQRGAEAISMSSSPTSKHSSEDDALCPAESQGGSGSVEEHFLRSMSTVPDTAPQQARRASTGVPLKARKLPASFFRCPTAQGDAGDGGQAPMQCVGGGDRLSAMACEYDALLRLFHRDQPLGLHRGSDPVLSSTVCGDSDDSLGAPSPGQASWDPRGHPYTPVWDPRHPGQALSPCRGLDTDPGLAAGEGCFPANLQAFDTLFESAFIDDLM